MKKHHITPLLALLTLLLASSCKKEFEPVPQQPANLTAVDFTGEWNAYGYFSFTGPVALETARIERRSPGSGSYIATKIKGDDGVPGGVVTWYADIHSNPFTATCILGNGTTFHEDPGVEFVIIDENTIKNTRYNIVYIRRSVDHF